jgi:hypothetical protein
MTLDEQFSAVFRQATGHEPYPYQVRLGVDGDVRSGARFVRA